MFLRIVLSSIASLVARELISHLVTFVTLLIIYAFHYPAWRDVDVDDLHRRKGWVFILPKLIIHVSTFSVFWYLMNL